MLRGDPLSQPQRSHHESADGNTLDIVAKDKDAEGKVVGTCDGGTKKIIYTKASAPAATPAKETPKP
jgi:hypothetical protein